MGSAVGGLVSGGLSLVGGMMSDRSDRRAADAAGARAGMSAEAMREAARMAAQESRFRPVAVRTGFGGSNFEFDSDGRIKSAGYELTPEMQAMRNQLIGQAGQQGMGFAQQGLGAAQGMFNLGQGYLAQSPEAAAQQWMQTQQEALAPQRQQAMSGLMNKLAQTGTQGLGVAQAGGGQANPLMQAFANAQAQQDLELAARAQEQGRAQTQFGTGLLSDAFRTAVGGYAPLETQLQQAQGIEGLGQDAFKFGIGLGEQQARAGASAANAIMQGGMGAAETMGGVQGHSSNVLGNFFSGLGSNQGFGNAIGGMFGGGSGGSAGTVSPMASYAPGSANARFSSWF